MSCRKMDLMRETSFVFLLFFGLKSHIRLTLSHSVPGTSSSRSLTKAASACLRERGEERVCAEGDSVTTDIGTTFGWLLMKYWTDLHQKRPPTKDGSD